MRTDDDREHPSRGITGMDCFAALAMTDLTPAQNVNARDKPGHDVVIR